MQKYWKWDINDVIFIKTKKYGKQLEPLNEDEQFKLQLASFYCYNEIIKIFVGQNHNHSRSIYIYGNYFFLS